MRKDLILALLIMAGVTALLRMIPFLWQRTGRVLPERAKRIIQKLPYASMAMLVVYCLKDVKPLAYPYGLPELIACAVTAGLHIWKRNTLISIACGTAVYTLLVQVVFV